MKYVFDLDGTLCTIQKSGYKHSKPIAKRIEYVNELYNKGHEIIIYTARGMGSNNNNQLQAINAYYSLTEAQIISWGIKYHLLIFGKPSGDIYVDDKGVKDEEFFQSNP